MEKDDEVSTFQDTWAIRLDKTYRMYKEIRSDFQRFGEYEITLFDNLNNPVVVFKVDEKFLENWQRRFVVNVAEDLSTTGAIGKELVREIFSNKNKNRNPLREEEWR
jgi:hypothetical protein